MAAVDDNRRLCEFIYRNLGVITQICATMDTHQPMQIFHSMFLVNEKGEQPPPFTIISNEEIEKEFWKLNPEVAESLDIEPEYGLSARFTVTRWEHPGIRRLDFTI